MILKSCSSILCNGATTCNSLKVFSQVLGSKEAGTLAHQFTNIYHEGLLILLLKPITQTTEVIHNTELYGKVTIKLEQIRICKEAVVAYFKR